MEMQTSEKNHAAEILEYQKRVDELEERQHEVNMKLLAKQHEIDENKMAAKVREKQQELEMIEAKNQAAYNYMLQNNSLNRKKN